MLPIEGGATGLERRRLYQLISPVCVRFNNICVTQEARWAWTTPRCASASSGGLSSDDALQSATPLPRRALRARAGAHQHPGAPLVSPASLQHLGLLGTASVWAAHRFNDRQVWSCSSCCRRNLSAAYSHYQQPCVKEPSVENLREAMYGDAARTPRCC